MKDLPFYEVVMEKRVDDAYLVTGNIKHFPKRTYIVTARQMLDIIEQRSTHTYQIKNSNGDSPNIPKN